MKFPVSLWFFIACAVEFLLQVLPIPGIFLMFMGAGLWSVALINFGFAGLGYEAITKRISRWWLLAPILWFAGYPAYVAYNNSMQEALAKELANQNAQVHIPFDPNSENLFYDGSDAEVLIQDYKVPALYSRNSNGFGPDKIHVLASGKFCQGLGRRSYAHVGTQNLYERSSTFWPTLKPTNMCVVSFGEDSKSENVIVNAESTGVSSVPSDRSKERLQISLPNGKAIFLNTGYTYKRSWFPQPAIGCFLVSGGSNQGWRCFAEFIGTEVVPLLPHKFDNSYHAEILANALGLQEITDNERKPIPDDDILNRIKYSLTEWPEQ